jgi:hypothetical protein
MSYRCMVTGKQSREGEKLNKIVIETRAVEYKHYDREAEEEWFSHGTEIVREINACTSGLELWDSWNAEEKSAFVETVPKTGG